MRTHNNLSRVYWIGGSTCAGKTTITNMFSEKYGLKVYHCDEHLGKHIAASNIEKYPNLNRATRLNWDEILGMSVEEYLKWSIGMFTEEFEMILEDLSELYGDKPVLVEGVGLFPGLVYDNVPDISRSVWLVAGEVFYKKHQAERKELFERVKGCSNPAQALSNYMSFDLATGRYILNDAKRLGLNVVEINDDSVLAKTFETVSHYLNFE
ncbi:MAG TPA: hypothetical protein VHT96_18150 [Clostridia bacterium]|nr:hypothetical protein [Clostridia bacterium]